MAESKTQDPKYIIIDGQLANASTREFIPQDEPIFIFRAKDILALGTLMHYSYLCTDPAHIAGIKRRISEFRNFAAHNHDRMSFPDTDVDESWPEDAGHD